MLEEFERNRICRNRFEVMQSHGKNLVSDDGRPLVVVTMCKLVANEGGKGYMSSEYDSRSTIFRSTNFRSMILRSTIFRSMIFGSTIDGLKKKWENWMIQNSEHWTGSSRSTVASEETDVGVMFGGEVDITGLAANRCAEINTDARIASTVCRWSVQGAAVVKRSESLDLVDSRCYVNPKMPLSD